MAKKAKDSSAESSSGSISHRGYSTSKVFVPKTLPRGPAPGARAANSGRSALAKKKAS